MVNTWQIEKTWLDSSWQIPKMGPFGDQDSFQAPLLIKKHTAEGNVSGGSKYVVVRTELQDEKNLFWGKHFICNYWGAALAGGT